MSNSNEDLPRVGIVILNYNGKQHLAPCFKSLESLDYPREHWKLYLVDNGSADESVALVKRDFPWVELIVNADNRGFSAGCNQGAEAALEGDFEAQTFVFLNNDMRVEPGWLKALVAPIAAGECAATTAKMLSWDGKAINSAGGGMNFHGIGIQLGYLDKPGPEHDRLGPSLFACGGAMAIDAGVFMSAGGFDEEFFAYYEDVDLGWRLWVLGHRIHYVPDALCYHHHSGTSSSFPREAVRLLQVRNPLFACVKNYDDAHLMRILPAALALGLRRSRLHAGLEAEDERPFRIEQAFLRRTGLAGRLRERARRKVAATIPVRREAIADYLGLNDLLGNWEHWMQRRAEVQSRRRRSDEEIFQLFKKPLWCIEPEQSYSDLHRGMTSFFGIDALFEGRDDNGSDPSQ